ncbi:scamp family-domain-containing protein [Rhodocollybia butyracea]|uniref:Scamp family-domain-containing protein n=1 Tax=Rhodocollybia butyracea TaxID=206335 RepID=A0A9P5Q5P2_9AGAR|nr:scamp family-domain-containing protein [Rhodocollybia butyracea]
MEMAYILKDGEFQKMVGDYNENPFASSHSLDANPFDDPVAQVDPTALDTIRQREAELDRRERELNARAEQIKHHGKSNWPFFFPLIYHDISDEIPEASRYLITRLYQLWLVLLGTLILNMIACIFILIAGSPDGGRDVGAAIGYLFIISATSFLLWYRPIYNGYMKEQALYFYFYFFFCGFHLLFSLYITGSAGLIQTVQMFANHHWVAAVLGLVATIGWTLQGLGNAFYYRQIYAHHTAAGHTMEKAKTELASHGAKAYFTRG